MKESLDEFRGMCRVGYLVYGIDYHHISISYIDVISDKKF